jgi:hypothetical protein
MKEGIKQGKQSSLILKRNLKTLQLIQIQQKKTQLTLMISARGPLMSTAYVFLSYYRVNVIQMLAMMAVCEPMFQRKISKFKISHVGNQCKAGG